jgi:hypothetical protein
MTRRSINTARRIDDHDPKGHAGIDILRCWQGQGQQ